MHQSPGTDHGYDSIRSSDAIIARLRANHPSLIDLTVGRVERLLAALGNPEQKLPPVIHVAGTNGKGSTVAYLRSIAEAAGLTVHVITSPHLVRFAERIRIAGKLITDEELDALITRVEEANAGEPISFFEISTVLALLAFSETPADLCIVEVGLGGRFDATNVFDAPAVSVITPIDYDHLEMLGPELHKIAWEKAGIIKEGRPVISASQLDEALQVIEREAQEKHASLSVMGRDFDVYEEEGKLIVRMSDRTLSLGPPSLLGPHQFKNAGLAVAAMLTVRPELTEEELSRGVSSAVWPARMQHLTKGPVAELAHDADVWLDGGHNPHAGKALAETVVRMLKEKSRPLVMIAGMFARKDAEGFFRHFIELKPTVFTTSFDSPSAASAEDLAAAAKSIGLDATPASGAMDAIRQALALPGEPPLLLICGSLHFAGEILVMSEETWPN